MRIAIGPGPTGEPQHQSNHFVYDVGSGAIVGVYHFAGSVSASETERRAEMLNTSLEASGVPIEQLAILTDPDVPPGVGELRVEQATGRLVRKRGDHDPRIRP